MSTYNLHYASCRQAYPWSERMGLPNTSIYNLTLNTELLPVNDLVPSIASQVKQKGFLLVQAGINTAFEKPEEGAIMSYSATKQADYFASNIGVNNNKTTFDIGVLDIFPGMAHKKKITDLDDNKLSKILEKWINKRENHGFTDEL